MERLSAECYHLPINETNSLVIEEMENGLFNQMVVIFDVSGSMNGHRATLEILINAALRAGQLVMLFSSEAAFLEEKGEFSFGYCGQWWRTTNYVAALALLEQYSDSRVLFMTDGAPDNNLWRAPIKALHLQQKQNGGSLCSLYLTNTKTTEQMLAVLQGLCSDGERPQIVDSVTFQKTMLDGNAGTLGSRIDADSVQVGSFKVTKGPPKGSLLSTLTDVRQIAGVAAAVLLFVQQFTASLPVASVVRSINQWLGPHAHRNAYRLSDMCDALRQVAAKCGVESAQQQQFSYLLSVAGVVSGVTPPPVMDALQGLFDLSKIVAANSPMPAARASAQSRQAAKALQKTQARLPDTVRRAEALLASSQAPLLAGFPYMGVSVYMDATLKEQLAALKRSGTGGASSTALQQSPASVALYVKEPPRTVTSVADHQNGPSFAGTLLHIREPKLAASMAELFPYVVSGGLTLSSLAPYQLAEIVFSTLSAPLTSDRLWVIYAVLTSLKHYTNETFARQQTNPFDCLPGQYYRWADSFRAGLQVPTQKVNLLAPILASDGPFPTMDGGGRHSAQKEPLSVPVLVQCLMPLLKRILPSVDSIGCWLELEKTPQQVVTALASGVTMSAVATGGLVIVSLDESVVPDMRLALNEIPPSLPGIAVAGLTADEIAKVYAVLCAVSNGLSPLEAAGTCNVTFDQVWAGNFRSAFLEATYRLLVVQLLVGEAKTIEAADLMSQIKLRSHNGALQFELPMNTKNSLLVQLVSDFIEEARMPSDLTQLLCISRLGIDMRKEMTEQVLQCKEPLDFSIVTQLVRCIDPAALPTLMRRLKPESINAAPQWPEAALLAYALSVDLTLFPTDSAPIGPIDYSGALNLFVTACGMVSDEAVGARLAATEPAVVLRVAQTKPLVPLLDPALQQRLSDFLDGHSQLMVHLPGLLSYPVIYQHFQPRLADLLQVSHEPTAEQRLLATAIRQCTHAMTASVQAALASRFYSVVTMPEAARETARKFMDNIAVCKSKSKGDISPDDVEQYCLVRLSEHHGELRRKNMNFQELLAARLAMEHQYGPKFKNHNQAMQVLKECEWDGAKWIVPSEYQRF